MLVRSGGNWGSHAGVGFTGLHRPHDLALDSNGHNLTLGISEGCLAPRKVSSGLQFGHGEE